MIPFSPEYGLVRRCLEMLEANTNGLVDCEFGGLTMTSLSSTSRALGYLARLETHCKCVTQGYLDTGEKSTGRLVIDNAFFLGKVGGVGPRWKEREVWLLDRWSCQVPHSQAGRSGGRGVESSCASALRSLCHFCMILKWLQDYEIPHYLSDLTCL